MRASLPRIPVLLVALAAALLLAGTALSGDGVALYMGSDFGRTPGYDDHAPRPGECNTFYCDPSSQECLGPALTHCVKSCLWTFSESLSWEETCRTYPCR